MKKGRSPARAFPSGPLLCALFVAAMLASWVAAPAARAQASDSAFTWATRYDAAGRITGHIAPDPDGGGPLRFAADRTTFDPAGRPIRSETGELADWQSENVAPAAWAAFTVLQAVDTQFDPAGRKVRDTVSGAPAGGGALAVHRVTDYSYDAHGRLLCTAVRMNPAEFAVQREACQPGTPSPVYGPDRVTLNSYDEAGQLVQTREGVGTSDSTVVATRDYTLNGKLKTLIDGNGNRSEMRYDQYDRLQCWILPSPNAPQAFNPASQATALATAGSLGGDCAAGDFELYGYDDNSNRTSLRKRDGSTLGYQYDALDRMTLKVVPERAGLAAIHSRDVEYEYDLRGLQTAARFAGTNEAITTVYNGFGSPVSSSSTLGGVTRTLGFEWNADGSRTALAGPGGYYAAFDHDGLDRLSVVRESGGIVVATLTYGRDGQRSAMGQGPGQITSSVGYAYEGSGQLATLTHQLGGAPQRLAFLYNPASQVVSRTSENAAYDWVPPYAVNRTYHPNGLNQYGSTGGTGAAAFGYDANGNLTATVPALPEPATTFLYDVENRLVSASGAKNAQLLYDPLGRLWEVTDGGGAKTRFLYDGDALIAEFDEAGSMRHAYVHGAGADEPLVWHDLTGGPALPKFLHANHQGSVIAVADSNGNATAINSYDPWGVPGANNQGRFQYTGQAWLAELGMYYYKARIYWPLLGRFLQVDPVGYEDQVNLYAYARNDPVSRADSAGTDSYLVARGVAPYTVFSVGTWQVQVHPGDNDGEKYGHGFIVVGADYVGDPNADVISFGDREGSLEDISDLRGNLSDGSSTHDLDRQAWLALRGSDRNFERIDAPDALVARIARLLQPSEYKKFGPNSTSAAVAVALRAERAADKNHNGALRLRNFDFRLPGVGSWKQVPFDPPGNGKSRPCNGQKTCF